MQNRVYVIASEYSEPIATLGHKPAGAYKKPPDVDDADDETLWQRLFFSAPAAGQSWCDIGAASPPSLVSLLISAAHRAVGSLHELCGNDDYSATCWMISDLLVASMPLLGDTPDSNVNPGLIPLMMRAALDLEFDCRCQFVAGTADSGAAAFASAVRIAQSRSATLLVAAGQLIPSGYAGQYRIRSVFTPEEQMQGLDMMAIGDVLMDALRRTHARAGYGLNDCQRWLSQVRQRKLDSAQAYPAALGVAGSDPGGSDRFVTRYFRSADVARAGCGAAAVILTSDPAVLARIRRYGKAKARGRGKRYRNTPVVEVVGVGEGTTNPRVLVRRSPLVGLASIRQAMTAAADDAAVPLSVFPDSAFAVIHDAFPSLELAFLLAIGLDWQRAALRMTTWWSNPYGGLLAFGDAVGASGLVHICKAFHAFTGDRRYIRPELNQIRRFRREGSYAFTSSVGGPLSHIVVSILRGGIPPTLRDQVTFFEPSTRSVDQKALAREEMRRRNSWRRASQVYVERLHDSDASLWLIEGVTEIDARSCAHALSRETIATLELSRLAGLVGAEHAASCRTEVLALVARLRADHLAARDSHSMRAAREQYNRGLEGLLETWSERGMLLPDDEIKANLSRGAPGSAADLASGQCNSAPLDLAMRKQRRLKAFKQCVRVPAAILMEPGRFARELVFTPSLDGIDEADFMRRESSGNLAVCSNAQLLPWWYSRARRRDGQVVGAKGLNSVRRDTTLGGKSPPDPDAVFDALTEPQRSLADERQAELSFLRAYFAPSGPQAAVDLAIRDLGVAPEVAPELRFGKQVPAIFYKNDIIGSSTLAGVHEAYELLGRAVQRARGWFGMYASTCAQHGDSVSLVSLDRRLEHAGGDQSSEAWHARTEAISNASRFARDVAEWCLGYGIRLRTVVSFGHGVPYRDVNDDRSVASDSAIRGARLLDYVTEAARDHGFAELPWIVFDMTELADIAEAVAIFERELLAASGPNWRAPDGPSSPIALDRWDDIHFTVWYRPASP